MKIAIITHSLRYNYGGILQNYALQQVLKQMGHEPCTIKVLRKDSFQTKLTNMLKRLLNLLHIGHHPVVTAADIDVISSETDKFIDKHIVMSPRMADMDIHWIKKQHFDVIVVGSDQVLHPSSCKKIQHIYLDFLHGPKKLMYAASFGFDTWKYSESETHDCSRLLADFDAVSVRENVGRDMMKEHLGACPELVLDPTLLLDAGKYRQFCSEPTGEKYLAYYFLDPNDKKLAFVNQCAEQLGLKVVEAGNAKMDMATCNVHERKAPSVESWLSTISNAAYVITDSYHGTLFAIIFQRQFLTIVNSKRGAERFRTVLGELGVMERSVNNVEMFDEGLLKRDIEYADVDARVSEQRKMSIEFLRQGVNG